MTIHSMTHGAMLLGRKRYKEAEEALRQELAANPQNGRAHALLSVALLAQKRSRDALQEIRLAIHIDPNDPYHYYVQAMIHHSLDHADQALSSIQEAIRLDPEDADYYAYLSKIYLGMKDREKALAAAEEGRRLDPESVDCINLQAAILTQMGRKAESTQAIDTALELDPENPVSHTNYGWACLHRNQIELALGHFREALRIKPDLEMARNGIVEALKARNPVYRAILQYFLWMSRMNPRTRWGVLFGFYILARFIRSIGRISPELQPVVTAVTGLYVLFAVLTWTAQPLFNLLLRLDRFGRYALSREQITASNWIGGCILLALASLAAGLATGLQPLQIASLGILAMILPLSGVFQVDRKRNRTILAGYTALLALAGLAALVLTLQGSSYGIALAIMFFLGWVMYTWVANIVAHRD